jgi:hypothetical protein
VVLTAYVRKRLLATLDRWMFLTVVMYALGVLAAALLLYKTQNERVEAMNTISALGENAMKDSVSWSPPSIDAPVDFRYLDDSRISGLYSEFEPQFVEKQRTLATEGAGAIMVGVGGSKVEASGKVTATSLYQKELTPQQKCIELMNVLLMARKVLYFTTAADWKEHELERAKEAQRSAATGLEDLAAAEAKVFPSLGYTNGKLIEIARQLRRTLSEPESQEDVKRLEQGASQAMIRQLSRAEGLAILDGLFQEAAGPPENQTFETTFSAAPRVIKFRFHLKPQARGEPITGRLHLRVLGTIIHQMGEGNHMDIFPIAIF